MLSIHENKYNSKEYVEIAGSVSIDTVDKFSVIKGKRHANNNFLTVSSVVILIIVSLSVFVVYGRSFLTKKEVSITKDEIPGFQASYDDGAYTKVEKVTDEMSRLYNVPTGLKVLEIKENTPPYDAGLRINDIIVEFDNKKVYSIDDIENISNELKSEERAFEIPLNVYRNGSYIELNFLPGA